MWIELRADGAAHNANWFQIDDGTSNCAADEIAMPADIFRQRIKRQIGAVLEGRLEHGPKECVVATDNRSRALLTPDLLRNASHERDIDETIPKWDSRFGVQGSAFCD